jgi:hypothetical protein
VHIEPERGEDWDGSSRELEELELYLDEDEADEDDEEPGAEAENAKETKRERRAG